MTAQSFVIGKSNSQFDTKRTNSIDNISTKNTTKISNKVEKTVFSVEAYQSMDRLQCHHVPGLYGLNDTVGLHVH
jgi:hypothetical protein